MDGVDGWPKWVVHLWQSVVLFLEGILKKFYASLQGPATLLGRELNLMWTALSLNDFT